MIKKIKNLNLIRLFSISLIFVVIISFVCFYFLNSKTRTIQTLSKFGSKGSEVTQIQQKLKEQGFYYDNVDGIYGKNTENAVIKYQQSKGLRIDGIAGSETLSSLGITASSGAGSNQQSTQTSSSANQNDAYILAKMISAEARGEPFEGQVAVGAVIMNRVRHPSFPNTISGVLYESGAFSALTDGQYYNEPIAESAHRAADLAIKGWDPSGGAIYYFNPNKTSNAFMWSRPVITVIGSHRFCS
ncbi:MAG: spore cortex-lytic enzyme [Oscillospiraceae bacterium]|nr:spore cortex-lytic enzyme [Oscillospiraceae bacterium]